MVLGKIVTGALNNVTAYVFHPSCWCGRLKEIVSWLERQDIYCIQDLEGVPDTMFGSHENLLASDEVAFLQVATCV